jgi:hypothetical protein
MSTARPTSWTARLAWGALLLLVGAGLAIWGLAHWQAGARFLGVAPDAPPRLALFPQPAPAATPQAPAPDYAARLAGIEQRLAGVENATQAVAGSAGRADNLLIAFAARRAVERGAPLGYLEPLLIERFGARQQAAVTMVISAARQPQTIDQLTGDYQALRPALEGPPPDEGWWTGLRRELGSLVAVRRADRPSPLPAARYARASDALRSGKVAITLAETMRMPGAARPEVGRWTERARRWVATEAALDQLESQALVGNGPAPAR